MEQEINVDGASLISSRRASNLSGYSQDYIGQLARRGEIKAERIGGLWYVDFDSLEGHKKEAESYVPVPPIRKHSHALNSSGEIVSFDGKQYISSRRASELTGYSLDYVSQLARECRVGSRQVGPRWYVNRVELIEHKRRADAQLAAVQAGSMGVSKRKAEAVHEARAKIPSESSYRYVREAKVHLPTLNKKDLTGASRTVFGEADEKGGFKYGGEDVAREYRIPVKMVQMPPTAYKKRVEEVQERELEGFSYIAAHNGKIGAHTGIAIRALLLVLAVAVLFFAVALVYIMYTGSAVSGISGPEISALALNSVQSALDYLGRFFIGTESYVR